MRTHQHMVHELQLMIRDLLDERTTGQYSARSAQTRGYVDGYMKALLDLNVVTQQELLTMVNLERERIHGPALHTFKPFGEQIERSVAA